MKISRAHHAIAGAAAVACILSHHQRAHAWDSQQDGNTPIVREQNWAPTFLTQGQFRMHGHQLGFSSDEQGRSAAVRRARAAATA